MTEYASTQTVKVFARDDDPTAGLTATKPGVITLTPTGAADAVDRPLTSLGMYYRAEGGTPQTLEVDDPTTATPPAPQGDTVGDETKPVEVFSYEDADGGTVYAVLHNVDAVSGGDTTYSYATASIMVAHDPDGDAATTDMTQVNAELPVAKPYSHIHFGVWASLDDASPSGAQDLANLGIGFLQSIGDGLTADMPNNGTGTYAGNWVGSVQDSHPTGDGNIREMDGAASMTANFRKGEVDGALTGLATFEADIEGSSFSTDEVDVIGSNLDADANWTGDLSGGFYGDDAIESGGVFSFATKDNEGGAFTGAFGTVRTDE